MSDNKQLVVNDLIWLHGTDAEFTEYRKPSRGFGRLGVMLTLDLELAEHYGSIVLENTVSVAKTLFLGQDDSDVWASLSSGGGEPVKRITAEYDSVLYERETEAGESFCVLVVFDPANVQITGIHKPEIIRSFKPMRMG